MFNIPDPGDFADEIIRLTGYDRTSVRDLSQWEGPWTYLSWRIEWRDAEGNSKACGIRISRQQLEHAHDVRYLLQRCLEGIFSTRTNSG